MMDVKKQSGEKVAAVTNTLVNRSIVPFTSGLLMVVYAFFWPESYGRWLGTIVGAFRHTAGF